MYPPDAAAPGLPLRPRIAAPGGGAAAPWRTPALDTDLNQERREKHVRRRRRKFVNNNRLQHAHGPCSTLDWCHDICTAPTVLSFCKTLSGFTKNSTHRCASSVSAHDRGRHSLCSPSAPRRCACATTVRSWSSCSCSCSCSWWTKTDVKFVRVVD